MPIPQPGDEAYITAEDIDDAVAWWRENCPPGMEGLIDPEAPEN